MKSLTVINPVSKSEHEITFSFRVSSPGKIVIKQDERPVGKINIKSKAVFCDKPEVYQLVHENVDYIINSIKN